MRVRTIRGTWTWERGSRGWISTDTPPAVVDRETPLAIALDDLHWIDDASRALVEHVAHAIAGASSERGGLCLILSYRTGEASVQFESLIDELLRAPCTVRVRLRGFAENDVKLSSHG